MLIWCAVAIFLCFLGIGVGGFAIVHGITSKFVPAPIAAYATPLVSLLFIPWSLRNGRRIYR